LLPLVLHKLQQLSAQLLRRTRRTLGHTRIEFGRRLLVEALVSHIMFGRLDHCQQVSPPAKLWLKRAHPTRDVRKVGFIPFATDFAYWEGFHKYNNPRAAYGSANKHTFSVPMDQ
jgi:hypothetical protein